MVDSALINRTTIEWTESTWNPVIGCDKVSPGCNLCYVEPVARRVKAMRQPDYSQNATSSEADHLLHTLVQRAFRGEVGPSSND